MIKNNKNIETEKLSNIENELKAKLTQNSEIEFNKLIEENKNLNTHNQNLLKAQNKREMILQAALEKADKLKEEKAHLLENLKNIESEKNDLILKLSRKNEELVKISDTHQSYSVEDVNIHSSRDGKVEELSSQILELKETIVIEKEKNDGLFKIIDLKTKELTDLQSNLKTFIKKEMLMQSAIEKAEKLKEEKNLILEQLKRLEKSNEELKIQINEKNQIICELQDNLQTKLKSDISEEKRIKEELKDKELVISNLNQEIQALKDNIQSEKLIEYKFKEFEELLRNKDLQIYTMQENNKCTDSQLLELREENGNLIKELEEKESSLQTIQGEVLSLNELKRKLEQDNEIREKNQVMMNNQINEYTIKIETLTKEVYNLTNNNNQKDSIISQLKKDLALIREENNQLLLDCKNLTDKNLEIVNYTVEYESNYNKISNENKELLERLKKNELKINDLEESNLLSKKDLINLNEGISKLNKLNEDLNSDIIDKTKKLSLIEKNINEKNKANLDLKSSLEGRDIELMKQINLVRNIRSEKEKIEEETLKMKNELENISQKYSDLQKQMIFSEEEKRNIIINLKELEEKYSSNKRNYENYLNDTQREMLELKEKLDKESQNVVENKKLTDSVSKIKQELENTNFALLERIALLEEAFKNNKTEGENIESLKKQYLDLTKENEANNIRYQNTISQLNNNLSSAQSKLKTLESEIDNKTNVISSQKETMDRNK
jgi:chromosome segregation ATPase